MNTIDELMNRYTKALASDPTDATPADIDAIIAYHRAYREGALTGPKKEKVVSDEPKKKLDLQALGFKTKPASQGVIITRRL